MAAHNPGKVAVIIEERSDFAPVLGELRVRAGWSTLEFDDRAGFHQGYTGKLECRSPNPDVKRWGFHIRADDVQVTNAGQTWLDALGVALVLVDKDTAAAIGAVHAPKLPPGYRRPAPNRKTPRISRGNSRSAAD